MVLNNIAGHMSLLPADTNFRIGSYCSLTSLNAYSRTCKDVRNSCGMLKLNELYTCALQEFLKLQDRFVLRCKYSDVPESMQNVLTVQLKDYKPGIEAKASLQFQHHSIKKCEATVGFVVERNAYFVLEDMTDILTDLKEDQFFIAARLGNPKETEVQVPENTSLISRLYFTHINPDTFDLVRTVTYPVKDVLCVFNPAAKISEDTEKIIRKALSDSSSNHLSSFTYSLSSFM